MKKVKGFFKVIMCAVFVSTVSTAWAMSPAEWMQIELQVRQLTVDGMEQRLMQLHQGRSMSEQLDADAAIQQAIVKVFQAYGTSAADHLRWKNSNQETLDAWLADNYEIHARLLDIHNHYQALAESLSALKTNQ